MSVGIKLKVGKVNVRTVGYPSEASYVRQVNQGLKQLEKSLIDVLDQFMNVTPEVMLDAMRPIYDLSQEYVPVRDGKLKNSGYLEVVERGSRPYVEFGYAKGGRPDYAVYVHEMIEIPHKAPTRAKYAEQAVNDAVGETINRLVANYREFMGE